MQAGAVKRKRCKSDFACMTCRFDRALRRIAGENKILRQQGLAPKKNRAKITFWHDRLNALPLSKRPCIHHMKGRIEFRPCTNDYLCSDCEFDQYFQDEFTVHAVVKPVSVLDIAGVRIPQGYYLHRGHAWVKIEENSEVRIGLDDFAMRVFGPLDRIASPLIGKVVNQHQAAIAIHRGAHDADVLSPVSGIVTAVNSSLRENGELAKHHPYDDGWILRVHAGNLRQDLKDLMIGAETEAFMEKEVDRVYALIEEKTGPLAADGGFLGNDIFGSMPQLGWDTLKNHFLQASPVDP
jgi:glycine cleavage system H lipoate-binding protein